MAQQSSGQIPSRAVVLQHSSGPMGVSSSLAERRSQCIVRVAPSKVHLAPVAVRAQGALLRSAGGVLGVQQPQQWLPLGVFRILAELFWVYWVTQQVKS